MTTGSISRNQTYPSARNPTNEDVLILLWEKHMLVHRLVARALKNSQLIRRLPGDVTIICETVPE
jgi:hypothetical protein